MMLEEDLRANLIIVLVFEILMVVVLAIVIGCKCTEKFEYPIKTPQDQKIPKLKWPFLNLENEKGDYVPILVIRAYLDNEKYRNDLIKYHKEGWKILGCSSNQSFPRCCDNPHGSYANCKNKNNQKINGKDIQDYVIGWAHCFRDPDKFIRPEMPKMLISESDFNSVDLVNYKESEKIQKKYDYICVQPKQDGCTMGWHAYYKNWPLCEKCILVLSDKLGLKGLVVGWDDCPIKGLKNTKLVEKTGFLHYWDFIKRIKESRFMLLPNLEEASPRIETEALACNIPIFVYENILGGWKYVHDDSGVFFNENNIESQALELMEKIKKKKLKPRDYFINNYDKKIGVKFKDWLKELYPELPNYEYVKFSISG